VGGDVPVDSETLLVADFVNLKIKPAQSFEYTHRDRMYVYVFIGVSVHMYINIYVYTVFLKKKQNRVHNMYKESIYTV
jgi:cytochrome bd-type quinol oxidase subunit 2